MKSYVVIGLGRFGASLARQLCKLGAEVLALDVKGDLDDIGKIKDQGEEFGKAWAKNREQEIKDKGFVNKSVDDWLTKNAYNWEEWNEKFKVSDIMIFAGA